MSKKKRIEDLERQVEVLRDEVDYLFKQLQIARNQYVPSTTFPVEDLACSRTVHSGFYRVNANDEVMTNA